MKKSIIIECPSCNGTGLVKDMSERGKCAVVCHNCKGTGSYTYFYKDFTERKIKDNIKRVFQKSCGFIHSDENVITEDNVLIDFEAGGCTYEQWLNGNKPKPVKTLYCPYLWDNRGIGNEPLEDCKVHCVGFGSISDCKIYHKKSECWIKYEQTIEE